MDVQMPEMDGFEATAAIRRARRDAAPRLPIIAMTAHAMKGDRERCLEAGMDEYLTKPLDPRRLCALVERMAGATSPHGAQRRAARMISDEVLARVGGDRRCLPRSAAFSWTMPRGISQKIREALDAQDGESLRRAAHGLKGAAANSTRPASSAAARTLEEIGRTGDFRGHDEAWLSLSYETGRLIRTLRSFVPCDPRRLPRSSSIRFGGDRRGTTPATTSFVAANWIGLMWNKDEVQGKVDQVKGKVKEKIGEMNDDEQLRNEGEAQHDAGHVEEAIGKGRRKVGEAIKDIGDKIGR